MCAKKIPVAINLGLMVIIMRFHSTLLLVAFLTLIASGVAWTSAFQPSTIIPFARRMRNLRSPTLLPVEQQYPHPEKCAPEMTCVTGSLLDMHMPATRTSNGMRHCRLIRLLPCHMYVCCLRACMYVCIHVWMYVSIYPCMFVRMYVCMYAFTYTYKHSCMKAYVCISCIHANTTACMHLCT